MEGAQQNRARRALRQARRRLGHAPRARRDHTRVTKSAIAFFGSKHSSDPAAQAARLAEQFIQQNAPIFQLLQVSVRRDYDGRDVLLEIQCGSAIGAVPLVSLLTGRQDFDLVIQPRFPWTGIGPMLAEMGWLITPTPLRLPLLKRSERQGRRGSCPRWCWPG